MYIFFLVLRVLLPPQLDRQVHPVRCSVCYSRGNHTAEEVAKHFTLQQKRSHLAPHDATEDPVSGVCRWTTEATRDIAFTFEDGSRIEASRALLASKNDVLNSMLMGSFAEGKDSSIRITETSKASWEILIHFLYECRCPVIEGGDVRAYLELVFLTQMYFVENLKDFALAKIVTSIRSAQDVVSLYESGIDAIDETIILQALCTVLVRPMKTWKRSRWLKELFESSFAEDIDQNIRMILRHPLDINRLVCNCDQSLSLYRASESEYTKLL